MPKNLSIPLPKEFTALLYMPSEWLNKARQFECKLTKVVNLPYASTSITVPTML